MNSILTQALAVVECARSLQVTQSTVVEGMYRIACSPRDLPVLLRDLAASIEKLDSESARAKSRDSAPSAALAVVMHYVADCGIDVSVLAGHVREAAPELEGVVLDALAESKGVSLRPKPGEIDVPDLPKNQTADLAAIRTRASAPRLAPKHADGNAIQEKYDPDRRHDVVLGGEVAHKLDALISALSGKPMDPRLSERSPSEPERALGEHGSIDHRNFSNKLAVLLDGLTDRVNRLVMKIGRSARVAGLASQFENIKARLVSEAGANGVVFEMTAGIEEAVLRVENEIGKFEADSGFEEVKDWENDVDPFMMR